MRARASMIPRLIRSSAIIALFVIAGCKAEIRTMLVVEVGSNFAVPAELTKVEIVVNKRGQVRQKLPFSLVGEFALPVRAGLLAVEEQGGEELEVSAVGYRGTEIVGTEDAVVAFIEGRSMLLKLYLARECRMNACRSDQTCTLGGACRAKARVEGDLETFDPASLPPKSDAAASTTPTADARADGQTDSPLSMGGDVSTEDRPPMSIIDAASPVDAPLDGRVDAPADASAAASPDVLVDAGVDARPDSAPTPDARPPGVDGSSCDGVDLTSNGNNCGACGYRCLGGRSCQAGRCTPSWVPASNENGPTARIRHGASVVSGRVLISGGSLTNNTGAMADSFFYDPATDAWSPGPRLNQARCAHSSVGGAGKVFVFGGLSDCGNGAATGPGLEEYDPVTNAWKNVTATGAPTSRYNHNSLWLPGSEMLVFGGGGSSFSNTDTAGRYKASAGTWTDARCLLPGCATGVQGMFTLDDNTAVLWAGSGGVTGVRLDLRQNVWSTWTRPAGTPPLPGQFAEDSSRWFVLNGDAVNECPSSVTVQIFDKAKGTWSTDSPAALPGIAVTSGNPNHTVWTGQELFIWSAQCNPKGVGWRYQPRAPASSASAP